MVVYFSIRIREWGHVRKKSGSIQDGAIVCSVGISSTNLPCWNRLGVSNGSDSDGFKPIFFFINRTAAKVPRSYGMMVWYHFRDSRFLYFLSFQMLHHFRMFRLIRFILFLFCRLLRLLSCYVLQAARTSYAYLVLERLLGDPVVLA